MQFNIWKQCIQQRENDEVVFTSLVTFITLLLIVSIEIFRTQVVLNMEQVYGQDLFYYPVYIHNSTPEQLKSFCPSNTSHMFTVHFFMGFFWSMVLFNGLGFLTAFTQKMLTARLIQNVELSYVRLTLELSIVINSIVHYFITI